MRCPLGVALMANELSSANKFFPCLKASQGLVVRFRRRSEFLIIHLQLDAILITTPMLVTDSCWPKAACVFPT